MIVSVEQEGHAAGAQDEERRAGLRAERTERSGHVNALTIPAHSCASTRSAIIVTMAAMAFMAGRVARGVEAVA